MLNLFISIYSGGGGREVHETFKSLWTSGIDGGEFALHSVPKTSVHLPGL
jgi:hypothetical protein